jgi:hypothetical protein
MTGAPTHLEERELALASSGTACSYTQRAASPTITQAMPDDCRGHAPSGRGACWTIVDSERELSLLAVIACLIIGERQRKCEPPTNGLAIFSGLLSIQCCPVQHSSH